MAVEQAFREVLEECYALFLKKHHDYGFEPIAKFGAAGVLVRLSDKIERLIHLFTQDKPAANESLEDTLKDIVNYAVIFLLLLRKEIPANKTKIVVEKGDLDALWNFIRRLSDEDFVTLARRIALENKRRNALLEEEVLKALFSAHGFTNDE